VESSQAEKITIKDDGKITMMDALDYINNTI